MYFTPVGASQSIGEESQKLRTRQLNGRVEKFTATCPE
jgi:hypothetical protein